MSMTLEDFSPATTRRENDAFRAPNTALMGFDWIGKAVFGSFVLPRVAPLAPFKLCASLHNYSA